MAKRLLLGLACGALVIWISPAPGRAETIYAVTEFNTLVSFNSSSPTLLTSTHAITGLAPGDQIIAIDLRPATGVLYGLGSTSRLYTINPSTGAATVVGSAGAFTLSGTSFGFDFNPVPDRIRVVSDADQNLRLNPNDGTLTATDVTLAYATGDPNLGQNPNVTGAAYTNNFAGATSTTLFGIDSSLNILVRQGSAGGSPTSPNSGQLFTIGALGVDPSGSVGFDISGVTGTAYASLVVGRLSRFYTVNLATGAATLVGTTIDTGITEILDITVGEQGPTPTPTATSTSTPTATPTVPVGETIYAVTSAFMATPAQLITFNSATPGTVSNAVTITGLQPGETIVGIDLRPATGQLYALGSTSRLYTINPATGAATQVGTAGAFTLAPPPIFGFDFNPVADRIRVVNGNQNLRLNPNDGALTATDTPPAYAPADPNFGQTPFIVASAYSNNFAGTATTTLYDLDIASGNDRLVIQNPPNAGTLNTVGPLGLDAGESNFDISGVTGIAYASLQLVTGGVFATINLATGAATIIGPIPLAPAGFPLSGMTVAQQGPTATPTPTSTATPTGSPTPTTTLAPGVPSVEIPTLSGSAIALLALALGALGYFLIRGRSSPGI